MFSVDCRYSLVHIPVRVFSAFHTSPDYYTQATKLCESN